MCWITVLLRMYLKAGCEGSAPEVLGGEVFSIRDLRMVCWGGVSVEGCGMWEGSRERRLDVLVCRGWEGRGQRTMMLVFHSADLVCSYASAAPMTVSQA